MTMKYSTKLSDAVHIMIFIHLNPNMDLSSQAIAKSLKSNPSFVRQILMKLRTAGLVQSVRGRPRPKLARDPGAISLLEIYRAVEGGKVPRRRGLCRRRRARRRLSRQRLSRRR